MILLIMILFDILYSFGDFENNLIYLNISYREDCYEYINSNLFENINKFKALKYLFIESFRVKDCFIVKLNNLRILSIHQSKNITVSEVANEKLELLKFIDRSIDDINML